MSNCFPRLLVLIFLVAMFTACGPTVFQTPSLRTDIPVQPTRSNSLARGAITAGIVSQVESLQTFTGHQGVVRDLVFSGDGLYLGSSSDDRTIKLWHIKHAQLVHSFDMTGVDMKSIAFSPDGGLLASGEAIWDVGTKQELHVLERSSSHFPAPVAFSPDGAVLAVAVFNQPIKLWAIASGQVVHTFETQADNHAFNIEFSPDGTLLAAGGLNGTIRLWDVASGQIASTLEYGGDIGVHDVAFSPDGNLLASGGTIPTLRLWDVASGEVVKSIRLQDGLMRVDFSSDGTIVATAGGNQRAVVLWDVESGALLRTLPHTDQLMVVTFSPNGRLPASVGYDNTIILWGIPQ